MTLTIRSSQSIFSAGLPLHLLSALFLPAVLLLGGYVDKCAAQGNAAGAVDQPEEEIKSFRTKARGYFKASDFRALEDMVAQIRSGPPVFASGSWRLYQFYSAIEPNRKDSDEIWRQEEGILQAWEMAFPKSITARIAHANFMTSYAWKARGSGWANSVNEEGWKVFGDRLSAAQKILTDAREMQPRCPMWWRVEMTVALGGGWDRSQEARLLAEAKKFFPQFYGYDTAHAYFLLPRWNGEEGDWEKSAEEEMQRPDGLGAEGYARVVASLTEYYGNIFRETHASWPKTREGFEQIHKKYPASLQNLTMFFELACIAGDRELAQQLLKELNGYVAPGMSVDLFQSFQNWTLTGQPAGGVSIPNPR